MFAALSVLEFYGKTFSKIVPLTLLFGYALIILSTIEALIYLFLPGYADHVEPSTVVNALNAYRGVTLYPDWERGEGAYGLPYGPALYLAVGAPLQISKTVLASKLAACAAFLLSLALVLRIGRRYANVRSAPFAVQYYWLGFLSIGYFVFFVRPEPFLMAASAAGAALMTRSPPPRIRWLAYGLLAGVATALKAHAALYFLPLGVFALARSRSAKDVVLAGLTGAAGLLLALIACFLADPAALAGFLKYNLALSREGLRADLLLRNALTALVLAAPYGSALWLSRSKKPLSDVPTALSAAAALASLALFAVMGSKVGSGPAHLMPLAPALLVLTCELMEREPSSTIVPFNVLQAAMCLALLGGLVFTGREVLGWAASSGADRAISAEALELSRRYPGAQFGPTDSSDYDLLAHRVGPALDGAAETFSVVFWMDLAYAGVDPLQFEPHFRKPASVWIFLPPVSLSPSSSYYTQRTLFPAVKARFPSVCRTVERSARFRVWRCEAPLAAD